MKTISFLNKKTGPFEDELIKMAIIGKSHEQIPTKTITEK
jgi:hypothetical protein